MHFKEFSHIDCTFATLVNQTALALGANIVFYSLTKYIACYNHVLASNFSVSNKVIGIVCALHNVLGDVMSWLYAHTLKFQNFQDF